MAGNPSRKFLLRRLWWAIILSRVCQEEAEASLKRNRRPTPETPESFVSLQGVVGIACRKLPPLSEDTPPELHVRNGCRSILRGDKPEGLLRVHARHERQNKWWTLLTQELVRACTNPVASKRPSFLSVVKTLASIRSKARPETASQCDWQSSVREKCDGVLFGSFCAADSLRRGGGPGTVYERKVSAVLRQGRVFYRLRIESPTRAGHGTYQHKGCGLSHKP